MWNKNSANYLNSDYSCEMLISFYPKILLQQDSQFDKLHCVKRLAKIKNIKWQDSEIPVLLNFFIVNKIWEGGWF